jgi:hypothetical protein
VTSGKKPEGPRERVEGFASRRGEDTGKFISMKQLSDGYVKVKFQNGTYFTPMNDRAVYREGNGYQRPALGNASNE